MKISNFGLDLVSKCTLQSLLLLDHLFKLCLGIVLSLLSVQTYALIIDKYVVQWKLAFIHNLLRICYSIASLRQSPLNTRIRK